MNKVRKCSPETRERAVRLVRAQAPEHAPEWAKLRSILEQVGANLRR